MTCLRFSRFRLLVALVAVLQLAAAALAFAQKAPAESGAKYGCEWSGWLQPIPWSSISAPRKLRQGESVKVAFNAACAGVGVNDVLADGNSWIMFGKDGGPGLQKLEGDGFTVERTGNKSFTLTVSKNAAPGGRSFYSMDFVLGKVSITPMQFSIAGNVTATKGVDIGGDAAGFCCRKQGSPCVALKVGGSDAFSLCGDGNVWAPVTKQQGFEASKMLCDYACAAPSACLQKSGDCAVTSPDECRKAGGGLFPWGIEECQSYAVTANMPDKFYFSPSAAVSQTAAKGSQKPGKPDGVGGTCMQVKPLSDGTYPHPVPPVYDTHTKSAADCADASKYYCVTMPVGGALQRGCTSMPIQIPEGAGQPCSDYDETGNPEDPLKVSVDGATLLYPPFCKPQSGGGGNAAYSRYKPRPGSEAGPDGGFSTVAECRSACPPCRNKDCTDLDRPEPRPQTTEKPVCGNGICEKNEKEICPACVMAGTCKEEKIKCEAGTCPKDCKQGSVKPQCRKPGYSCMTARQSCEEGLGKVIDDTDMACRGGDPEHPIMDVNCAKCELVDSADMDDKQLPICKDSDCGPIPLIADRPCPDGSTRRRQCVSINGKCAWQWPECKPGASSAPTALAVCKVQPAQSGACGDPFRADGLGFCLGDTGMLLRQCGGDYGDRYQPFRCPDGCGGGACKSEHIQVCEGQEFFCSKIVDENGQCTENNLECEGNEKKVCSRSDEGPPKQRSCGTKSCEGTCCRCVPYTNASKCGDGQCTEAESQIMCPSCVIGTPAEQCRCRKVCEDDCGAYDDARL